MLSKEGLIESHDWEEEDYEEFRKLGLLPDKSEQAKQKFDALMEQGPPFDYYETYFLGSMDLQQLSKKYPDIAEEYMHF